MRVGLREANQRFSSLIRVVRAGKQVVLTDRGKPVAILKSAKAAEDGEAALRRLEGQGARARPSSYSPLPPWKPRRIRGAAVSATLREERDAE